MKSNLQLFNFEEQNFTSVSVDTVVITENSRYCNM